jgi:hypothetical protein
MSGKRAEIALLRFVCHVYQHLFFLPCGHQFLLLGSERLRGFPYGALLLRNALFQPAVVAAPHVQILAAYGRHPGQSGLLLAALGLERLQTGRFLLQAVLELLRHIFELLDPAMQVVKQTLKPEAKHGYTYPSRYCVLQLPRQFGGVVRSRPGKKLL